MKSLKTEFENCYGIKKLKFDFDFNSGRTFCIYSPNGTMKTSFANTFQDFSFEIESLDRVFTKRISKRVISNEQGGEISPSEIFVVKSYDDDFKSKKVSTLLVNRSLREEYEKIYEKINEKKDLLVNELMSLSGVKKNLENVFSFDFTNYNDEFFKALLRVKNEVLDTSVPEFSDVKYLEIFNDKVVKFLETKDFRIKLAKYIEKYDELIKASSYFQKGIFNHNNAAVIAKNLKDNGFFKAAHSVFLNPKTGESVPIINEKELEDLIENEKSEILSDPGLIKAFEEIDKKLKANADLRRFRDYLINNSKVLPELLNLNGFKQKLWISYLKERSGVFLDLEAEYVKARTVLDEIIKKAKNQQTEWHKVIDIFNARFSVPFKLSIKNQDDVILKSVAPTIEFEFFDKEERSDIGERDLLKILSNGEKRALYILNIIFEVETRKQDNQETLFIVDDIADSFDYKNKYAIVEYLQEISQNALFKQIILSHNYDFYRTISGRLDVSREHKLIASRADNEIIIEEEFYQGNPFNHWKKNLNKPDMLLASIPFVRNLADFLGDGLNFKMLTSLFHIKEGTSNISMLDLENIYNQVFRQSQKIVLENHSMKVVDLISDVVAVIVCCPKDMMPLEHKIVLSIAIRLEAEKFMINSIGDDEFVAQINKNQTFKLYERYKSLFENEVENLKVLGQVNLMTPENIHLNSFMYEPILDMGAKHLKKLYEDVVALS